MKLTPPQLKRFWREWAAAARAQKWTREDGLSPAEIDQHRRDVIQRAGFNSLTAVDRTRGFDRLLADLGRLQSNIARTIETDDRSIGEGRRLRWVVHNEQLPCLRLYVEDPARYVDQVISDKFGARYRFQPDVVIEDLDTRPQFREVHGKVQESDSQLMQLVMTLEARINELRRKSGDSIHDMKTKAGLHCSCRLCCLSRMALAGAAPDPYCPSISTTGPLGAVRAD